MYALRFIFGKTLIFGSIFEIRLENLPHCLNFLKTGFYCMQFSLSEIFEHDMKKKSRAIVFPIKPNGSDSLKSQSFILIALKAIDVIAVKI